ncbi:hypothetical protein POM88_004894 [Heracleum sosnowskyi]|uniref:Histone deacetylase domain-containing protein n=1 Tax=Heracleum sosnowskyi TaxID=360622 RepID=A0AAD8NCZ6_9APIA|nr:hypothetical protein POM88_004894 [Heracleum sosnowskyi]
MDKLYNTKVTCIESSGNQNNIRFKNPSNREEYGDFYPYRENGSLDKIGDGNGTGFDINVPWDRAKRSNADYLAVMDHALLYVARVFKPDIVLVSAGFDAAKDDPIGDCVVTAEGFADMLKKLPGEPFVSLVVTRVLVSCGSDPSVKLWSIPDDTVMDTEGPSSYSPKVDVTFIFCA